jgi:hypothetical protein
MTNRLSSYGLTIDKSRDKMLMCRVNQSNQCACASGCVVIVDTSNVMTGPGQHRLLRHRIQEDIKRTWPELSDPTFKPQVGVIEIERAKIIKLDERQMRALAEGFVGLLMINKPHDQNSTGGTFLVIKELACKCRCWTWVEKQLTALADAMPGFNDDDVDPNGDKEISDQGDVSVPPDWVRDDKEAVFKAGL